MSKMRWYTWPVTETQDMPDSKLVNPPVEPIAVNVKRLFNLHEVADRQLLESSSMRCWMWGGRGGRGGMLIFPLLQQNVFHSPFKSFASQNRHLWFQLVKNWPNWLQALCRLSHHGCLEQCIIRQWWSKPITKACAPDQRADQGQAECCFVPLPNQGPVCASQSACSFFCEQQPEHIHIQVACNNDDYAGGLELWTMASVWWRKWHVCWQTVYLQSK